VFEWEKIRFIQDEEIIKFLGSNMVAFRHEGYYVKHKNQELYVIVTGNGVIIQIHNCSYIMAVVKNGFLDKDNVNRIYVYAVQEVHGIIAEQQWLEKYKNLLERDFNEL
jgi:hypothetical protein